jgi:hypothetical protein
MRNTLLLAVLTALFPVILPAQKKDAKPHETKVVTGSVLLNQKAMPDAKALISALKSQWKLKTDSLNVGDKTVIFTAPGATVMLAFLDYPVGPSQIQGASRISWLWPAAATEAAQHKAQLVISVIGTNNRTLELYRTFTKVAAAVLEQSNASGIYMDSQYLLLPKGFYTAAAKNMTANQTLPVYCWIYFGMVDENGATGGYTYGLQEFGLPELEVVQSKHTLPEVHTVLYEAATQILRTAPRPNEPYTITTQEEQKVTARTAKAMYAQGTDTALRFDY